MQHAKHLATTLTNDPQMRLPVQPRLSDDLVKVWHNRETVVVFGGLGEVVLRGKSVSTLLPKLLPLLNGRLTVPEIIARVDGVRPEAVEDALFLLYTQGLLEDGKVSTTRLTRDIVHTFDAQLAFYGRYIDYTRASTSRYEVLSKLQTSTVLLFGSGPVAHHVASALLSFGLGRMTVVPLDGNAPSWSEMTAPHAEITVHQLDTVDLQTGNTAGIAALLPHITDSQLLLLVTDTPNMPVTRMLNQVSLDQRVPFLRSYLGTSMVEIGPTVFTGQSSCYECAHLLELIDLDHVDHPEAGAATAVLTPPQQIGASQTALFVLAILTRFLPIKTGNTFYRLVEETLELEPHAVYTLPGCPACSTLRNYEHERTFRVSTSHTENWPVFYHINTNEHAYSLFPKGHQVHYMPKNTKTLSGAYKTYRNRMPVTLPPDANTLPEHFNQPFAPQAWTASPPWKRTEPPGLADIGRLLQLVAGRQTYAAGAGWQIGLRVTPSAGALGSQTLYLVNFSVSDLPTGLYHFNPHGVLETLHQRNVRKHLDQAVIGAEDLPANVVAAIIVTSAFGRIESKYQAKSYRYALYDAGAMLHSLQVVSQLLGWELWQATSFYDDEVCALLKLHSPTEFPVCVTYLVQPEQPGL